MVSIEKKHRTTVNVITVDAHDNDTVGPNNQIEYSITSGNIRVSQNKIIKRKQQYNIISVTYC